VPLKAREVIYRLNDGVTDTGVMTRATFSAIGSGVQDLVYGEELGEDYAIGYVKTRVYNGYAFGVGIPTCTYGQTIAHSAQLTVTN
jgi:tetrahydromethanopterin S-methyltransferase subunit E